MEEKKKYHYLRDGKKVEMTLEEARALNESKSDTTLEFDVQWYLSHGYITEVFDCVRNTIIDESIVRKKIVLTESDLKMMVKNCVRKVLSESEQRYNVGKIGKWNRIPSNGYEFHKIPGKGTCVGIMMYVDSTSEMEIPPTYCLFRRGDNGKYFYATIVASPKDGPKATKFSIVPLKELPEEIYKDLRNLSLQA